jgi:hypothetical protein
MIHRELHNIEKRMTDFYHLTSTYNSVPLRVSVPPWYKNMRTWTPGPNSDLETDHLDSFLLALIGFDLKGKASW